MEYEEDHYPHHHHHHHYPHHPPGRRKLKSTCSVPPSDQSGGDSSDCDSVHSLPVSHVVASNSDSATKSYAAIARNPPQPPPLAVPDSKGSVDEWPQVAEKADLETASSSVSSTTTEPNTPPEESVNVLHDYYPSLAESIKGGRKPPEEQQPLKLAALPNGEVKPQQLQRPPVKASSPPESKVAWKPPLPTNCQAPPPPKRVIQNQPPVIFDEKTLCGDSVEGLTFGFSVNPSLMDEVGLLLPDCVPAPTNPSPPHVPPSPKALAKQQSPPKTPSSAATATPPSAATPSTTTAPTGESDLPTSKKTRDFAAMYRPPPQIQTDSTNQYEIIRFVGSSKLTHKIH